MTDDLPVLRELLASGAPLTWVFTGDSITHGLIHTRGARNYVDHLHELIRGDVGRVQDTLINTAITGWRADLILDDFDRRVARWQPDVVTLMIGTNDCTTHWLDPVVEVATFTASVVEVVRRVRDGGGIPVLQTPPTVDLRHAPDRARIGEFARAVRDAAVREGAILVDHHAAFTAFSEGTGPGNDDMSWGLLDDAFHPNAAGHALLALGWADALGFDDPSSRVRTDLAARVAVARHPHWPPA
ncbi:SGNH/GDSL hydrolase family protein [Microbacterium paraoxydans]|uniref:SGNH/GDSL hydrolase family protein n=1 Tax=Microbacterium paraoxydans TaxID=199592 RepID=UPI001CF94720|nr:SGNH/GDSL hydrolase family protein [Microbacterium paraoxydans]